MLLLGLQLFDINVIDLVPLNQCIAWRDDQERIHPKPSPISTYAGATGKLICEVAKLFTSAGVITLTAFISPYRADRHAVRALLGPGEFIEIFMDTPLAVCEARDPKGLYKKARAGQIKAFTGIDDPYEAPEKPELVLDGGKKSIDECADDVLAYLTTNGLLAV